MMFGLSTLLQKNISQYQFKFNCFREMKVKFNADDGSDYGDNFKSDGWQEDVQSIFFQ